MIDIADNIGVAIAEIFTPILLNEPSRTTNPCFLKLKVNLFMVLI